MDHVPENELAIYAFDSDALPAKRRMEIDQHVAVCNECRATLEFFNLAEEDLRDVDVWEAVISSSTLDALRVYADQIAAEDRDAEVLLAPFLASPITAAWTDLSTRKRFLTGGVVRRLNAHAHDICETAPLDALTFAEAAISVSERLSEDAYRARAVYDLRGTAWKERARALHLLGRLPEALESLTRAERAYRQLNSPAFGLSIVALVRAAVLYEQQRLNEAAAVAEQAEKGFSHLGDDERRMQTLFLLASIELESQNTDHAVQRYQQILEYGEGVNNPRWIARASYAIGNCEVDRGRLGEASMHFHKALALFREVGPDTDRVNAEWGIARVFLHAGQHDEASRRLHEVVNEFEARGMVTDAALAGLDVADALLAMGLMNEIVELASRLFGVFRTAGMFTGALTAIAYLKEAASSRNLTSTHVQSVRVFLRRAERHPELVFSPLPTLH